jgi:hypothetical protein
MAIGSSAASLVAGLAVADATRAAVFAAGFDFFAGLRVARFLGTSNG